MADDFEKGGSPLYAGLARTYADDPRVGAIAGDHKPYWEVPLRLLGGVHYLALAGRVDDPWKRFPDVLDEHRDWLAQWVGEQPVQTNEVQRCWALLPAFLSVADGRPLDLVELGASAGLNLFWDRYRYRYGSATWGSPDARLELAGEAGGGPPEELFRTEVDVRGRVGIDRRPVDVTTEEGALLLQAFVWPDQQERLERLRRAIEVVRAHPPELVQGDFVELLPGLLERRASDALTVVFHSASVAYLDHDATSRLRQTVEEAGANGALAWIAYEFDEEEGVGFETFALDVRVFPGDPKRLARVDGHGNRLRWVA